MNVLYNFDKCDARTRSVVFGGDRGGRNEYLSWKKNIKYNRVRLTTPADDGDYDDGDDESIAPR